MSHPTLFPILPSEKPPKKPWLLWCGIVFVLLSAGFFAGRGLQHLKTGYHFEVRDEQLYPFGTGTIRWRYVTETIGAPFLDPGTTYIEYIHDQGGTTTIYKAQRVPREPRPFAENIKTSGNTITWDDREFRYKLEIEAMPPEKAPEERPDKGVTISSTK